MKPSIHMLIILISTLFGCNHDSNNPSTIIHPSDGYTSIQEAIDSISNNGSIYIEPGIYNEVITITNKIIHLKGKRSESVINGQGSTCLTILNSSGSSISGLTIINGIDGIYTDSYLTIEDNIFLNNGDGVDYKSGGGILQNNTFHMHEDDAIDLDNDVSIEISMNLISSSKDDGIEIRLNQYTGPALLIEINKNTFKNNWSNGIQIIDYETITNRSFEIRENTFIESQYNEISYSDNLVTTPSFDIGNISEQVTISNNIFYPSVHSFTGAGDNTIFQHNIIYTTLGNGAINSTNDFSSNSNIFVPVIDVY